MKSSEIYAVLIHFANTYRNSCIVLPYKSRNHNLLTFRRNAEHEISYFISDPIDLLQKSCDMLIIPFKISGKTNSHLNIMFIEKNPINNVFHKVYLFEPNGSALPYGSPGSLEISIVSALLELKVIDNIVPVEHIAPWIGVQTYEGLYPNSSSDSQGYCSEWCLFILETYLQGTCINQLYNIAMKRISKNCCIRNPYSLRNFIREYATRIIRLTTSAHNLDNSLRLYWTYGYQGQYEEDSGNDTQ
jgi:hypothetical protein